MKLPADDDFNSASDEYVRLLANNLKSLRKTAADCIAGNEYQRSGSVTMDTQNIFQEGDLLQYDLRGPDKDFLPSNLTTPYKDPYVVISQYKNDITCRHANIGTVQVFHVDRVKPFYGSLEEATVLARVDHQQFIITRIMAYRGDPELRSKTKFLLEYEDGTISWKSWDQDLFDSLPYEQYCRTVPQLRPMILTVVLSNAEAVRINR